MQAHRNVLVLTALIATGALLVSPAAAQGLGEGLRIETQGVGLEPERVVTERFGIRALVNGGFFSYDQEESGNRYYGKVPLGTGFLLADWHPYAGGFRLSGGLAYNNERFARMARPGSTINTNSSALSPAEFGSLDGHVRFTRASPYVGVGWGLAPHAGSRLYFSADVGVMYQRPSAVWGSNCGAALRANACSHLQSDFRADDGEFREAADDLRFYPVISVGFGLRF